MKPFVQMRLELMHHIKLNDLALRLGCWKSTAAGCLFYLWGNVMLRQPEGIVPGWGAREVAYYAEYKGDANAFYAALVDLNWIIPEEDGIRINDWHDWCQMHAAQTPGEDLRAKWREQKRAQRARKKELLESLSADNCGQSADKSTERRGEERKEDQAAAAHLQIISQPPPPPQNAPMRVDLTERAGLVVGQVIAAVTKQGLSPEMREPYRLRLGKLCPVLPEELDRAIEAARRVTHPRQANLSLVVTRLEMHRRDAADAEAAGVPAVAAGGGLSYKANIYVKGSQVAQSGHIRDLLDKAKG